MTSRPVRVLGDALGSLGRERRPAGRRRRRRRLHLRPGGAWTRRRRRGWRSQGKHTPFRSATSCPAACAATLVAGRVALRSERRRRLIGAWCGAPLRRRAARARRASHGLHGLAIVAAALSRRSTRRQRQAADPLVVARRCCAVLGIALRVDGTPARRRRRCWSPTTSRGSTSRRSTRSCPQARFVSKADVQGAGRCWRGWSTRPARSIIERERKRDALRVVHAMAEALRAGDTVAMFPEGTTVDRPRPAAVPRQPAAGGDRDRDAGAAGGAALLRRDATRQRGGRVRRRDDAGARACGTSACGDGVGRPAGVPAAARHRPAPTGASSPRGCAPTSPARSASRRCSGRRRQALPCAATAAAALAAASASPR